MDTQNNQIFDSDKAVNIARKFLGIFLVFGFYVLLPLFWKGLEQTLIFIKSIINDPLTILIFLLPPVLFQIFTLFNTSKNVEILILKKESISIKLFGIFHNKTIELKYTEIFNLKYSEDQFKFFIFILKNGEEKKINARIKNKQQAFDLINKKIAESKNF